MFRLLALLLPRNWGRLSRAIFGDFKYRPPRWAASSARGVVDSMQRRPGAWASVIVLVGAAIAGRWYYQQWWEAHKPRPTPRVELREVAGTVSAPTETVIPPKGKPVVQPAVIRFSGSIAPIEKVGKPATGDVALKPEIAGEWKWTDDRTLSFMPAADWPAGVEYQATLSAATVPKEVRLKDGMWKFSTRELRPSFNSIEFYTDPQDPAVHQVVAEIRTNHPVSVKAVEQHLTVAVLGGTPLFNQKGRAPDAFFTVTEGKDQRQFFIRSARITIPEKEDFVKLTLREGIVALNGGKPATEVASLKVRVPDKFSGFSIGGVRTEIIRTSEGDPEQFLFVETKGYAEGAEIEKHLRAWFIPPFEETENKKLPAAGAVTEADIQRFQMKPVTLKRVETEKDEGAPVSTAHAFKFLLEKPGRLLVRVTRGATALGGFELARDFATYSEIATFPRDVEVIGRGGVLALNGEKKIGIKSRGVPWMRITLARVPFSQVQHLARFTNGDFQSPYFRGWIDESNIAHFHREVRKIPMRNEFEASYTTFDFSAAVQRADVSDPDASRGMFFITVEGVQPARHSKKRLEGDDVMTDWKPLRHGDAIEDEAEADAKPDDAAEEQPQRFRGDDDDEQVGVSEKRFILVTDMGLLVKRSADGTRDVFLQSVQRGEPVGGANVLVLAKNGEFITQTATSAEGRVKLPKLEHLKAEKKPVAIITRLGNDVAFIPFDRPDRLLDFSRFDVGGVLASEKETLDAHLFTERGIYRPGDEIHISAIVRRGRSALVDLSQRRAR